MDKIREEFVKFNSRENYSDDEFKFAKKTPHYLHKAGAFYAGYKSRDEEIKKLNEIISTQETYINNTLISDSDKVESKIKKLREDRKELIENIKYFVDRVEAGTIRSKKTYAIYTNLLSRMRESE